MVASKKVKILVANGVNLDLLGQREPEIYGREGLKTLEKRMKQTLESLKTIPPYKNVNLTFFQTNSEIEFLEEISKKWDGALINPGAWTHTSLALADRLAALSLPFVEVHISNLSKRESFRKNSYTAPHAVGVVYGFGLDSYVAALAGLLNALESSSN